LYSGRLAGRNWEEKEEGEKGSSLTEGTKERVQSIQTKWYQEGEKKVRTTALEERATPCKKREESSSSLQASILKEFLPFNEEKGTQEERRWFSLGRGNRSPGPVINRAGPS